MARLLDIDWPELRPLVASGARALIDTRTPAEFARGAIPQASNLPIMTNAERHEVGLTYKTIGTQDAVAMGVDFFAGKAESYLAACDALHRGGKELAVHCWRGGMRSRFTGAYLAASGFDTLLLRGGYKRYRRYVLEQIDALGAHPLVVLDGCTGSGKTDLLRDLPVDFPKLDLEGLARHRGSAFGDFGDFLGQQPPQQGFENQLADAYQHVAHWPTLVVEIENFIGPVTVPPPVQARINASPLVLVTRDFDDRVARLTKEYCSLWDERFDALFEERCRMLTRHLKKEELADLVAAVRRRDFESVVADLLRLRYDKVYLKGIKKREDRVVARFNLTHEEDAARQWLAERLGYRGTIAACSATCSSSPSRA